MLFFLFAPLAERVATESRIYTDEKLLCKFYFVPQKPKRAQKYFCVFCEICGLLFICLWGKGCHGCHGFTRMRNCFAIFVPQKAGGAELHGAFYWRRKLLNSPDYLCIAGQVWLVR